MAFRTQNVSFKPIFYCYYNTEEDYNVLNFKFFTKSENSAIFGNDEVKLYLTAFLELRSHPHEYKINFSLNLAECIKKKIVVSLEYRTHYSGNSFLGEKELEFGKPYKLNVPNNLARQENCMLPENYRAFYGSIEMRYTVKNEGLPNLFDSWNSSKTNALMNHSGILCHQLATFGRDSPSADVTIRTVTDGKEFKVHSAILAMRSSVFAVMFENERFKEGQEKKVEIEDIDGPVMEAFFAYLYGQEHQGWEEIAGKLAYAADKYDVQSLKDACGISLTANVTVENAAKSFCYVHQLNMTESMSNIAKFISQKKEAVRASDGWKELIAPNIVLLDAVFELS